MCAALAQTTPTTPPLAAGSGALQGTGITLAAAVEAAWSRAVSAREMHGQRQRALADRAVAAAPWAGPPVLGLSHRDDRLASANGARETEVALSWPLWLPGQRAVRAAIADADLVLADASGPAARLHLAGEVREVAWALVALDADAAQRISQRSTLQALADDVDRRVRAGDLARADALAARAEWMAATAQQAELAQRLSSVRARWSLLTGLDALPRAADLAEPDRADGAPPPLETHPDAVAAQHAVAAARLRLERVRLSRRDAPEVTLRLLSSVPGRTESASTSVGIALRLPLGTEDRNQPLQAAALADLDLAQARAQRLRDQLQAEQTAARNAVAAASAQADAEHARASLLRERADLVQKSFKAGETPLPDLLRVLSAAAQADASATRQHAAVGLARAQLQQAFGVSP